MRIAFLIMAHKDPSQIARLTKRLNHPDFDCFIHLDAKINMAEFAGLAQDNKVMFTKTRIFVSWAAFSFTTAIYKCMEEILNGPVSYDFIQVMSAQDYPIVSKDAIHQYYTERIRNSFISCEKDGSEWWQHAKGRITHYHLINYKFPGRYRVQAILNAILPERKLPVPYILYGGPRASWFTVTADCGRYIVQVMNENPKLRRFCRFTWGSDEFLFQTLIMNSDFAGSVLNDVINYIDWSGGGANPKLLTVSDYDAMKASGKLFARKFDIRHDTAILDLLDQ